MSVLPEKFRKFSKLVGLQLLPPPPPPLQPVRLCVESKIVKDQKQNESTEDLSTINYSLDGITKEQSKLEEQTGVLGSPVNEESFLA